MMYIPACPLTEANASYLVRQREAFFEGMSPDSTPETRSLSSPIWSIGTPGPDFPSGVGESQHIGRLAPDFVMQNIDIESQRAMGLTRYHTDQKGLLDRDRQTLQRANEILGFDSQTTRDEG